MREGFPLPRAAPSRTIWRGRGLTLNRKTTKIFPEEIGAGSINQGAVLPSGCAVIRLGVTHNRYIIRRFRPIRRYGVILYALAACDDLL